MAMLATTAGATLAADITEPRYVAEAASAEEAFTEPVHSTVAAAFMVAVADSTVAAVAAGNTGHSKRTTAGSSARPFLFCFSASLYRLPAFLLEWPVAYRRSSKINPEILRRLTPLWPT